MQQIFVLRHLATKYSKKESQSAGFTLIELLIVIVIIGILSAIAIPSFLAQASKARASEAKQYISAINRAQQAYYLENNSFVTDVTNISKLGLGIPTSTSNYDYTLAATPSSNGTVAIAIPKTGVQVRGYIGAVAVVDQGNGSGALTFSVICESKQVGYQPTTANVTIATGPTATNSNYVQCDQNNMVELGR